MIGREVTDIIMGPGAGDLILQHPGELFRDERAFLGFEGFRRVAADRAIAITTVKTYDLVMAYLRPGR